MLNLIDSRQYPLQLKHTDQLLSQVLVYGWKWLQGAIVSIQTLKTLCYDAVNTALFDTGYVVVIQK